jgi:hypothetical protein
MNEVSDFPGTDGAKTFWKKPIQKVSPISQPQLHSPHLNPVFTSRLLELTQPLSYLLILQKLI